MPSKTTRHHVARTTSGTAPPKGSLSFDPLVTVGSSGLRMWSGRIVGEEPLQDLVGLQGVREYQKVANDSIAGAALAVFRMLMRRVEWKAVPADPQAAEDLDNAEYLEECVQDLRPSWAMFVEQALSMLPFGWAYLELLYKLRDGQKEEPWLSSKFRDRRIGWRAFALRPQDTLDEWRVNAEGELEGMWQLDPIALKRVFIPVRKALHVRPQAYKDNPEGRSVLRSAYEAWFDKTQTRRFRGMGLERDLAGLPVVRLPSDYMADDADANKKATYASYKEAVTRTRRNRQEGWALPSDRDPVHGQYLFDFSLLTSGGQRQYDATSIIDQQNKEIAMAVGADVVLIGHEGQGSLSLASTKTSLMGHAVGTYLDAIQEEINDHAVPLLFDLTPPHRGRPPPRLQHDDVEVPDLRELGEWVKTMVFGGVDVSDAATQEWMRRLGGMPPPPPEVGRPRPRQPELPGELPEPEPPAPGNGQTDPAVPVPTEVP